ILSRAICAARSPAAWPPMPSITRKMPRSASRWKRSSLSVRRRPGCVSPAHRNVVDMPIGNFNLKICDECSRTRNMPPKESSTGEKELAPSVVSSCVTWSRFAPQVASAFEVEEYHSGQSNGRLGRQHNLDVFVALLLLVAFDAAGDDLPIHCRSWPTQILDIELMRGCIPTQLYVLA